MKEREEGTISFPDITRDTWQKMMKFLDCPAAARKMTARDTLDVAVFYDKYEFGEGRELCDLVMVDYFKTTHAMEKSYTLDLDLIVELLCVAHEANLDSAFKGGMTYIWARINRIGDTPYGRTMFTEEHIKKLAPLLKHCRDIRHPCCSSLVVEGNSMDLQHKDFPKEFVAVCEKWEVENLLERCIDEIELSGTKCSADGAYYQFDSENFYQPEDEERTWVWGEQRVSFAIKFLKDNDYEGWAIVRINPQEYDEDGVAVEINPDFEKRCWIAPYSKNRKYPPLKGWIPSDPLATGNPTIKYILNKSIG